MWNNFPPTVNHFNRWKMKKYCLLRRNFCYCQCFDRNHVKTAESNNMMILLQHCLWKHFSNINISHSDNTTHSSLTHTTFFTSSPGSIILRIVTNLLNTNYPPAVVTICHNQWHLTRAQTWVYWLENSDTRCSLSQDRIESLQVQVFRL